MRCKKCDQPMVLRANREDDSLFVGCSGYPKCRATQHCTPDVTDVRTTTAAPTEEEEHPAAALWQLVRARVLAGIAPEAALAAVVPSAESPSHVRWLARKVQETVAKRC